MKFNLENKMKKISLAIIVSYFAIASAHAGGIGDNSYKDNDWGIFFKGEPIQMLPVQDGITMYKVNEVESDRLFDAIDAQLNEMENECQQDKNNTEEGQTEN